MRMRRVATCVCLLLAGRFAASAAQTDCVTPRDARAFFNHYLTAFNTRDWDAFRSTFDDSITVMFDQPAPPQRVDGRAAVEAMFRRVFPPAGAAPQRLPPPIVPRNLRVQDFGEVVLVSFQIEGDEEVARRTVVLHRG